MTKYRDLAPHIVRQRLVIEGKPGFIIDDEHVKEYLPQLSVVLGMNAISEPATHRSEKYGMAGWIHWETSGAHIYGWDEDPPFFSVDIYTCKSFEVPKAVKFTKKFFEASEITHKEF